MRELLVLLLNPIVGGLIERFLKSGHRRMPRKNENRFGSWYAPNIGWMEVEAAVAAGSSRGDCGDVATGSADADATATGGRTSGSGCITPTAGRMSKAAQISATIAEPTGFTAAAKPLTSALS